MKKPARVFGMGVSLREMQLASEKGVPLDYTELLLRAAIEKIKCMKRAKTIEKVREIAERPEWVENVTGQGWPVKRR